MTQPRSNRARLRETPRGEVEPPRGLSDGVPSAIVAMAERVVRATHPLRVILFGSQARGQTHRWSDVDLLIVVQDGRDGQQVRWEATDALKGSPLPSDVFVFTDGEVRRSGNLVGTVIRPALREGRLIYDASARPAWDLARGAAYLEVEPVSENERLAETREWVEQAQEELRAATGAVDRAYLAPGPACFLAQQAAEKALKAVLVFLQIDYPMAHDLDEVRETIPADWLVKEEYPDLKWLSNWAIWGRYPVGPRATEADARAALAQARAIYESVLRDLRGRGFVVEER